MLNFLSRFFKKDINDDLMDFYTPKGPYTLYKEDVIRERKRKEFRNRISSLMELIIYGIIIAICVYSLAWCFCFWFKVFTS